MLTNNGEFNVLANILSDNSDASIKVCRFNGLDKHDLVERNEFGYKCLLLAMNQAQEYVLSFNETQVKLNTNGKRQEIKLFDEESFKEAWKNACLHNKWSKFIPPVIHIFNDRIEIVSTGGLPLDFAKEEFFAGKSRPVNESLMKIMGQLNIVEQIGFGVPSIVRAYGIKAFDIGKNFIVVTLKFNFDIKHKPSVYEALSKSEIKVLNAIRNDPMITIKKLTSIVGLKTSWISIIIKILKDKNKITRVGSNKAGYWEVLK